MHVHVQNKMFAKVDSILFKNEHYFAQIRNIMENKKNCANLNVIGKMKCLYSRDRL
jgi:hypothetical protein